LEELKLLRRAERLLKKDGYSILRDRRLWWSRRKAVAYAPALYATKGHREKLAIEAMPAGEIPEYFVKIMDLCKPDLDRSRVRVRIIVSEDAVLSEDLRKASLDYDLEVCIVCRSGFKEIFSKARAQQIAKAEKPEVLRFRQERREGRNISGVLLGQVKKIRRFRLRGKLKRFAEEYQVQNFAQGRADPLDAEYEYVSKFAKEVAGVISGSRQIRRLDFAHRLERMRIAAGDYRDHFIHSFQIFLMGLAIIDSNYVTFRKAVDRNTLRHLEETWFLVSMFHDIQKPLEDREWLGEDEGLETNFLRWQEMIELMCESYEKMAKAKGIAHPTQRAAELGKVLKAHYPKKNHAIWSALDMINTVSSAQVEATPSHIAHAARSVAMHDKRIWKELVHAGIMPLTVEEDPITYLLIYCDTVQEWGRPGISNSAGLVGFTLASGIRCAVLFEKDTDATSKIEECGIVSRYLKTTSLGWDLNIVIPVAGI
jgi:hypothetical protein